MVGEIYLWHADKHRSFLQVNTIICVCIASMPKLPKIRSLHISPQKNMGNEVYFLSANEHEIFQQFDGITLVVASQVYPKFQKYENCNIFAIISQEKCER